GAGVDEHEHVATIAGVPLQATRLMESDKIILRYGDLPIPPTFINQDQLWPPPPTGGAFDQWKTHSLTDDTEPAENEAKASRAALAGGIMTRIENVIARTPDQLDAAARQLDHDRARLDELHNTPDQPFPEAAKLQALTTELNGIN